jgi:Flp pilus assembly protein TadG
LDKRLDVVRRELSAKGEAMKIRTQSKGQIAVLYVIALPALVGALALTIDVALLYANWTNMQRAADAAVLAGGASLPSDTTQAAADVTKYLNNNGVKAATEISSGPTFGTKLVANDTVSVTLTRTVPYSFARVLGMSTATVRVTSTAWAQPAGSVNDIVPVGLDNTTSLNWGTSVVLFGSSSNVSAPGNFGALDLSNSNPGASGWAATVTSGYNGSVSVGASVPTKPGLMDKKASNAFQGRIDAGLASDPSGTWNNHTVGDARDIVIPLVDWSGAKGKSNVAVTGFLHVWLTSVSGNGGSLSITGTLFKGAADVQIGGPAAPATSNVFRVVLLK